MIIKLKEEEFIKSEIIHLCQINQYLHLIKLTEREMSARIKLSRAKCEITRHLMCPTAR